MAFDELPLGTGVKLTLTPQCNKTRMLLKAFLPDGTVTQTYA